MPRSGKLNRFIGCPLELEDRRAGRLPPVTQTRYEAFGGTAQVLVPLQSFLPPWPWPLQAFLPAQSCLYSFDAQPPFPLHEFLPLQACLSTTFFASAIWTACDVALLRPAAVVLAWSARRLVPALRPA